MPKLPLPPLFGGLRGTVVFHVFERALQVFLRQDDLKTKCGEFGEGPLGQRQFLEAFHRFAYL